jgi:CheY-like chemotaxis protein
MFNSPNSKATILVADDNQMNRELLCDILLGEGYKPGAAYDE